MYAFHEYSPVARYASAENMAQSRKTVDLQERDRVIGHIIPEQKAADAVVWPDFEARRKKVFGDRILPGDLVIEERGRY